MAQTKNLSTIDYNDDSIKLAVLSAQLADDKLAKNVFVMDLRKIDVAPGDFFVICSVNSTTQSQAILNLILENCKKYRLTNPRTEGLDSYDWVIVDFFDVIVHIMLEESRDFYRLEKLWGDADFFTVNDEAELLPINFQEVLKIYNPLP